MFMLYVNNASRRRTGSGLEAAESVEPSIQGVAEKEYD
jgi:hypothetical protein